MTTLMPDVQIHGARRFRLERDKATARPFGLDTLTCLWQTESRDSFAAGGAPPDWQHMRIEEDEITEEIPGEAYVHRLQCNGLLSAKDKIERSKTSQPEEGWDTAEVEVLTVTPEIYQVGAAHPDIATLYLAEAPRENINGHVYRVSLGYKGIIPIDGQTKVLKRRITVNGQPMNFPNAIALNTVDFVDEDGVFNGWSSNLYSAMDTSHIVVTDTFLSTEAPPTDKIPGCKTPPDAPAIHIIGIGSFSVDQLLFHWPHGWKLAAINSERLLDKSCWLTTLTYEYQPPITPKG